MDSQALAVGGVLEDATDRAIEQPDIVGVAGRGGRLRLGCEGGREVGGDDEVGTRMEQELSALSRRDPRAVGARQSVAVHPDEVSNVVRV